MKQIGEVDGSDLIKDFSFGFKYNNKPFDMFDNEYLRFSVSHNTKTKRQG